MVKRIRWFYDLAADGYSLDDKRTPIKITTSPDLIAQYAQYRKTRETVGTGTANKKLFKAWQDKNKKMVDKTAIAGQKYDLSINRYKEVVYQEQSYAPPKEILKQLKSWNRKSSRTFNDLEAML